MLFLVFCTQVLFPKWKLDGIREKFFLLSNIEMCDVGCNSQDTYQVAEERAFPDEATHVRVPNVLSMVAENDYPNYSN